MYIVQVKKNSSSPFPKLVPLDSIPEQDNTSPSLSYYSNPSVNPSITQF